VESPVAVIALTRGQANDCLTRWEHSLGPCDRPFEQNQHGLVVAGDIIAVTTTASIVSPTLTDEREHVWNRSQVVELARICAVKRWATRPMLRLWREVLAFEWESWPVQAAFSYATPGKRGDIYRFDGWTRVRQVKKASPGKGSTWATGSATDAIGDGKKTLWTYRYPQEEANV
jgi:hypothetical protein